MPAKARCPRLVDSGTSTSQMLHVRSDSGCVQHCIFSLLHCVHVPITRRSRAWTATTACRRMPRAWLPSSPLCAPLEPTPRARRWAAALGAECAPPARWAGRSGWHGMMAGWHRRPPPPFKGLPALGCFPAVSLLVAWPRNYLPQVHATFVCRATAPATTPTLTTTAPCAA